MQIKIKCPAKINLILEILQKREDGFHEIQSIMQAVSLYDFLEINTQNIDKNENIIELSGNSDIIPYDNSNLVYKAAELFLKKANLKGYKIKIHIEKNIPVAAGLAGGSSNAAGTLVGLNRIFNYVLSNSEIHSLASQMGSDLNFCLEGGTQIATSRGEILSKIKSPDLNIVIIKPKNLFISAKEAYTKYAGLSKKPENTGIEKIKAHINKNLKNKIAFCIKNSLENAILPDYPEISQIKDYLIKKGCINALMSGSGPSVFGIFDKEPNLANIHPDWECFKVKTISSGIEVLDT